MSEQKAWLENKMEELRAKYDLPESFWQSAPSPLALSSLQISNPSTQNALWQPYGNGKLCEHDPNVRSGLRKKINAL